MTAIETLTTMAAHYEALGDRPGALMIRRAIEALQLGWHCEIGNHAACRGARPSASHLTLRWKGRRERVARAIAMGMTYPEIAEKLGAHHNTVKYHAIAIARDLGLSLSRPADRPKLISRLCSLGYGQAPDPLMVLAFKVLHRLRTMPELADVLAIEDAEPASEAKSA